MNIKLETLTEDNIDNYVSLWLEVLENLHGTRNTRHAIEMIDIFKDSYLGVSKRPYYLDFIHYIKVLKLDNKAIGFVNGIISYFESGIMLQIGAFGITRRYQKKGYGKAFFALIKEEMKKLKVNIIWLLPQNDLFWIKQGFALDETNIIKNCYSLERKDRPFSFTLSDAYVSFDEFSETFFEDRKRKTVRSQRSFK